MLIPEIVVANDSLDLSDTPAAASAEERTEADWRHDASNEAWAFKDAFVSWVSENLGTVRVDYKPKSYVGVRVGRRTWAPLWLRRGLSRRPCTCPIRTARVAMNLPSPSCSSKDAYETWG